MSAFTPGQRIHERFILRELIGRGGMSEVWRATDTVLGRPVAVKALDASLAADPTLWQATLREARAIARIAHPNVAQVHDYGEVPTANGHIPYLVMEYVEGPTLADRLRSGHLPPAEAASIAAQVAAGLAEAHRLGVVHRDVKPGNIMLTTAGVKILDFGIATLAHGPDADGGRLIGTPTYTAPERMQPGTATPAADVYALGVVLYELLTGHPPRAYADWQQALAAPPAEVRPIDRPGVPAKLAALTMACLSTDPARRPSAAELAADLSSTSRPFAAGVARAVPATQTPPTMVASLPPAPARRSWLLPAFLVTGGALVVLLVAMLVYSFLDRSPTTPPQGSGSNSSASATSPSAEPSPSPSTAESKSPDELLDEIAAVVSAADLPANRARDLQRKLSDLREKVDEEPDDAGGKIDDFRKKVTDLVDDGQLDTATGDQLVALLDQLADAL
ncbi:MAG: serine/threonine protein kinase [Hamadaea sp.]|uniref:serine/threonine-protein kinase n=1 Tax=Hamadaea sp. TaxID=2024425 RepID=UPI001822CC81|nr:serine/threonine-protein kinase [Hamadaea sp.]NUR70186.1 serine/threonine protein kinase [Hamadaea sp.]NUT24147.1 serine/threonine protein kinase [Hamadaea sp.]